MQHAPLKLKVQAVGPRVDLNFDFDGTVDFTRLSNALGRNLEFSRSFAIARSGSLRPKKPRGFRNHVADRRSDGSEPRGHDAGGRASSARSLTPPRKLQIFAAQSQ